VDRSHLHLRIIPLNASATLRKPLTAELSAPHDQPCMMGA
jgi:hypothetical protein